MKACEVLKLLNITRPTLCKYVKTNKIAACKMPNGLYDYDEDSIMKLLNKKPRKTVVYIRTLTDKKDEVVKSCIDFAKTKGLDVNDIYIDYCDGYVFGQRGKYNQLLLDVVTYKIRAIIIPNIAVFGTPYNYLPFKMCEEFACKIFNSGTIGLSKQEVMTEKYNAINNIINM